MKRCRVSAVLQTDAEKASFIREDEFSAAAPLPELRHTYFPHAGFICSVAIKTSSAEAAEKRTDSSRFGV